LKVILFGATGMVGQGVLRECLLDQGVESVVAVGRSASGQQHAKLRDLSLKDLFDFGSADAELSGADACFFCIGVSSAGMSEDQYRRVTLDLPRGWAKTLARLNPAMTFILVTGARTDSSERGSVMWARVKGAAENAIFAMPFKAAYAFRPAGIRPMHGEVSRTRSYRILYAVLRPLVPLLHALFPASITTTEEVGRAMIRAAREGAEKRMLESRDIRALGAARP
jgi:uncharacterized protein YbjT (DUF2867 family)